MSEARNGAVSPKPALPDSMIDPSGATIWQQPQRNAAVPPPQSPQAGVPQQPPMPPPQQPPLPSNQQKPQSPFQEAMSSMSLTPPEQYLYWHHLSNLLGPGKVMNPDNSVSTMLQAVVDGPHGLYYNIPTVWNGQVLDVPSARQMAAQAGWDKWPAYTTPEQADARYEQMHAFIERDTEDYMGLKQ